MEVVPIFAPKLYAFHYQNESENEYDRLIENWTDVNYLHKFAKENLKNIDVESYVKKRLEDAEQIIDIINEIKKNKTAKLETFFRPLHDNEYTLKPLSLQKGKVEHKYRKNDLRIYAIKIDDNCFVITGGAIKLSQAMSDNEFTKEELKKLDKCKNFLTKNEVSDKESFFEIIL